MVDRYNARRVNGVVVKKEGGSFCKILKNCLFTNFSGARASIERRFLRGLFQIDWPTLWTEFEILFREADIKYVFHFHDTKKTEDES